MGIPINQASVMCFVNSQKVDASEFSLVLMSNSAQIVFNQALAPGQDLQVLYFKNIAGGGGFGNVTGGQNIGSGLGIFDSISAGVMKLLSLKAGLNVSIAPDGAGSLVISATAGGGGSSRQVYGTLAAPSTFNPATTGLVPGVELDQTWITNSGSGPTVVTATKQIQPGTIIGQRLMIRGTSATNYYYFTGTAGAIVQGCQLNGDCIINNNQALVVEWDGVTWYEVSRRF